MAGPTTPNPAPTSPLTASELGHEFGPDVPALKKDATPEEKDAHWFQHVYQGDRMPQLTWRAVLLGGLLGMLLSAANLYTTLSIGWAFGIAITACVLSFVMWNAIVLMSGKSISQMSVLENACMASTASAAGYSTGSTIGTMFGALALLQEVPEGTDPSKMATWDVPGGTPMIVAIFTLCTGLMGVFLAIPMKRQMINHEKLPFPSGIAAAETLRSLYSASVEAMHKAYMLVAGLGLGLLIGFLRAGDDVLEAVAWLKSFFAWFGDKIRIPTEIEMHFIDRLYPGGRHPAGFAFEPSALLIAAGMIVGMRTSISLLVSSLLLYGVVAPKMAEIDAQRLERPAMVMVDSIKNSVKPGFTLQQAADASVIAARDAANTLGLDGANYENLARKTAAGYIDDVEKANAKRAELEKSGHTLMPAATGEDLNEGLWRTLATRFGTKAADESTNMPATIAAKTAADAALAGGATAEAAEQKRLEVFNENRYQPIFKWSWGGGKITITQWALWGGTSLMVFSSLMAVALQWKTLARAFIGQRRETELHDSAKMAAIEVPTMWMIVGMVPITIAMVWLQIQAFNVSWYAGIIAVAMSFVLSLVASRATGETDTTPIGAMGKVMQLMFSGLAHGNISANLASAGIAANSASSSADLLTDLKTGYLLGANPRKQFLAQFIGVFFGTVAIVPIWYLMVPNRAKLETFALPSTRAWEAVARVLVKGVSELPPSAVAAIFIGATLGIVLPIIDRLLPPKYRVYLPSATGMGLAWVMPFQNAFSFFVGAVIALVWIKVAARNAAKYNVALASGLIAGESLMAAGLAVTATVVGLLATPQMPTGPAPAPTAIVQPASLVPASNPAPLPSPPPAPVP